MIVNLSPLSVRGHSCHYQCVCVCLSVCLSVRVCVSTCLCECVHVVCVRVSA